jgi:hypothetical protein
VFGIIRSAPPTSALLVTHRGRHPERWGGYHDCFRICFRLSPRASTSDHCGPAATNVPVSVRDASGHLARAFFRCKPIACEREVIASRP